MRRSSSHLRSVFRVAEFAIFVCVPLGCWSSSTRGGGRGSGPPPEVVSISAGNVQSGFSTGLLRKSRELPPFQIAKYPVTWADFDACVHAGACASPDGSACAQAAKGAFRNAGGANDHVAQQPATCVGETQAEAYCHWVGGRLPTLDEWLLAARGETPHRYSWGDAPPTCDQHPLTASAARVAQGPAGSKPAPCIAAGATDPALNVHQHSAGTSPAGLEDVLLTPGELLSADASGMFNACAKEASHCVVFGQDPAAIDGVQPFYQAPATTNSPGSNGQSLVGHLYAFRCAFGGNPGSGK